ncbi:hemolymph glycoprotein [Chionoecetes opilio]|uniref:Hemolymph glycoprotein n=1 Tax=Chionoecetes opilio TaxID=41210 RepID=A0A8J4XQU8_CHIOP|nr:hemolymph glycoprotein [Chionoecetes opilio]
MVARVLVLMVVVLFGCITTTSVVGQQLDIGDLASLDNVTQIADWEERCRVTAGDEALKDIKDSFGELVVCVQKHIKMSKLEREVNVSIARGELDKVFKKYCKKRDKLVACTEDVFTKLERCTNEQEKQDLNVTRKVIDAGIDFVCHNDGDRIALFMAEKGEECLKQHYEDIQQCTEDKVPEIQKFKNNSKSIDIELLTINEENCKKLDVLHECVVEYTSRCDDETPANILGSLITQMLKVTPCSQTSSASTLLSHTRYLLPHLLTLLAAALTAANILL